MSMNLAKKGK